MELTLKLEDGEVNILLQGLGELPAKISLDLIIKIKQQGEAQIEETKKLNK
jgi:hypothetical protein